ncbi:HNH endonuclease signature motif containing protein [Streptomyces sp. NPDC006798]|uniref:HNH endonuclease n=1 Tax=unclassified Streptomyces TaxID=2593676 RepID=UPI00340D91AA
MKYCKKGDHEVPLEEFNKSKKAKDGLQSYCRDCQKGAHKETWAGFYEKNRDKRLEATKQWRIDNPGKRADYQRARNVALKNAKPYSLVTDWKEVVLGFYGEKCMKCGSTDDLTVDHIRPVGEGEHALFNMQVLCRSCNCSKAKGDTDYRPWPRLLDRTVS